MRSTQDFLAEMNERNAYLGVGKDNKPYIIISDDQGKRIFVNHSPVIGSIAPNGEGVKAVDQNGKTIFGWQTGRAVKTEQA